MSIGTRLLRFMYPAHEAQRMELRRSMLEAQAHAEDIVRMLRVNGHTSIDELTSPRIFRAKKKV